MKQIHRHAWIAALLAIALLLPVHAAQTASVSDNTYSLPDSCYLLAEGTREGDRLTVNVYFENNPGVYATRFRFAYNEQALRPVQCINGDVWTDAEHLVSGNSDAISQNPLVYYATSLTLTNNTKNGLLCTLIFDILDETADYGFRVTYRNRDVTAINPAGGSNLFISVQMIINVQRDTFIATVNGENFVCKAGETLSLSTDGFYVDGGYAYRFAGWSGNAEFAEQNSTETSFVMPDRDVTVTADYYLIGDLDKNGSITAGDTLLLLQMLVGNIPHSVAGDIDGDGEWTPADSLYMLQYTVGNYIPER